MLFASFLAGNDQQPQLASMAGDVDVMAMIAAEADAIGTRTRWWSVSPGGEND